MLTQVGPNRYVDLSLPEYKHLKPWKGGVKQGAPARPVVTSPARAVTSKQASTYKKLPPFPDNAVTGLPTFQIDREGLVTEFNALFNWMKAADEAPGDYHPRDEAFRDKVAERVDRLRQRIWA